MFKPFYELINAPVNKEIQILKREMADKIAKEKYENFRTIQIKLYLRFRRFLEDNSGLLVIDVILI